MVLGELDDLGESIPRPGKSHSVLPPILIASAAPRATVCAMQRSLSVLAAAVVAVFSPATSTAADRTPAYISDSEVQARFVKEMSKLLEDEKTTDPAELAKQLQAEATCELDLPTTRGGTGLTPVKVYQQAADSVLCFGNIYKCGKCSKWHANLAGGVILTADGIAVTNYHVMDNDKAGAFGAITRDGRVFPVSEVLASSKAADAAIVRLEASGLTPAALSINDPVGTPVCAITHPTGRFYTLTTGVISRYYMKRAPRTSKTKRVCITADFAKGSSGSGIFNDSGNLVAIVTSTSSIYYNKEEGDAKNLQMVIKDCVPAESILALVKKADR